MSWEPAVGNKGWYGPGRVDHHLLQGHSNENGLPGTFLVNMEVPELWHQVHSSSFPVCRVPLWPLHEVELKPILVEESRAFLPRAAKR